MTSSKAKTIHLLLTSATKELSRVGVDSPRLDAEILMAESLAISRTQLLIYPNRKLNFQDEQLFDSKIKRRILREPISHITGTKEFWSMNFHVNKNVLTPRPETEILIEQCLKTLDNTTSPLHILDLGAGSGNLCIVLVKEFPQSQVTAIEKSDEALDIARKNAFQHFVSDQITFISGDMMELNWGGPYNLIVSNPPYIQSKNLLNCMPEVHQFEPIQALNGGGDGLDFYRFIIPHALEQLEENGLLILEIGEDQASSVVSLLQTDYEDIQVIKDYAGFDRVIRARKGILNG